MARGILLAVLLVALASCGQSSGGGASDSDAGATSSADGGSASAAKDGSASKDASASPDSDAADSARADAGAPAPEYEDSTEGLQALTADLLKAIAGDDQATAEKLLASLRLDDYEVWFKKRFGDTRGARVAREYKPHYEDIGLLRPVLADLVKRRQRKIEVSKFESSEDPGAVQYQAIALKAMTAKVPLYSVRLSDRNGKRVFHLWSFAYVDGSFRYLGKLKNLSDRLPPESGPDPLEYRKRDAPRVERPSE